MSIHSAVYTLSNTTPTEIAGHDNMPHAVMIHNMTKSSNEYIFLGNENVSTTNAPHVDPGDTVILTIEPGDRLYAVSDPNGLTVGVLDLRKND